MPPDRITTTRTNLWSDAVPLQGFFRNFGRCLIRIKAPVWEPDDTGNHYPNAHDDGPGQLFLIRNHHEPKFNLTCRRQRSHRGL